MKMTDDTAGRANARSRQPLSSGQGIKLEKTITINRPTEEVYAFWSDLENLPKFMRHLHSVRVNGDLTSHWVVQTTPTSSVQWDAEILENRPGELISWKSMPGSDVDNAGSVWFSPAAGNRGTVVKVALKYNPPGGKFAAKLAGFFGEDGLTVIVEDLYRLKSLLETGETPTIEGQPRGRQ